MDQLLELFRSFFLNAPHNFQEIVCQFCQLSIIFWDILILYSVSVNYPCLLQASKWFPVILHFSEQVTELNHLIFFNISETLSIQAVDYQQASQCILIEFLVRKSWSNSCQVKAISSKVDFAVKEVDICILFIKQ